MSRVMRIGKELGKLKKNRNQVLKPGFSDVLPFMTIIFVKNNIKMSECCCLNEPSEIFI